MSSNKAWTFSKRKVALERAISDQADATRLARAAEDARHAVLALLKKHEPELLTDSSKASELMHAQWQEAVEGWQTSSVDMIVDLVPEMAERPTLGEIRRCARLIEERNSSNSRR